MKFYDREQEISQLRHIGLLAETTAQLTLLVGRRRVGKTSLLLHAFKGERYIYFFVGKKSEAIQAAELQHEIESVLDMRIYGQSRSVAELIEHVLRYSYEQKVTLIIDEFQRLEEIGQGIISDIQRVWDRHKDRARIHLIACGSVYSMMNKIFENSKEPLFGRKTAKIELKPFRIAVLKQILADHNPGYTPADLLMFYSITGGVAKYVEQLCVQRAVTEDGMLNLVCSPASIFIDEGTELLVGEFGRRYQTYYSILQLIASGHTSQLEIDSVIGKNTGRYLETLETQYSIIQKVRPFKAKPKTQGVKYFISDNFLTFWFRFIEHNRRMVELGKLDLLRESIATGYTQFSGTMLERYFRQLYAEKDRVTDVSHWWDSHGQNEIDLIAIEALDKRAIIAEVKRNPQKIDIALLQEKYQRIKAYFRGYQVTFKGLSTNDM